MKNLLIIVCMTLILGNVMANDKITSALAQYAWEKRQLIVFSPNNDHPQYQLFTKIETEYKDDIVERKLHTWHVVADDLVKLDLVKKNEIRSQMFRDTFGVNINEFRLLLIGYDQGEKLRQKSVNIDTVFSAIDQMPMRVQEMQKN